jgi:hypothetical protein
MIRIPLCLDDRLTDGGEVVSLTHGPHFTPQKHYFSSSDIRFCQWLKKPQDLVRPEGLGNMKNFIQLIGFRTPESSILVSFTNYLLHIFIFVTNTLIYYILANFSLTLIY